MSDSPAMNLNVIVSARNALHQGFASIRNDVGKLGKDFSSSLGFLKAGATAAIGEKLASGMTRAVDAMREAAEAGRSLKSAMTEAAAEAARTAPIVGGWFRVGEKIGEAIDVAGNFGLLQKAAADRAALAASVTGARNTRDRQLRIDSVMDDVTRENRLRGLSPFELALDRAEQTRRQRLAEIASAAFMPGVGSAMAAAKNHQAVREVQRAYESTVANIREERERELENNIRQQRARLADEEAARSQAANRALNRRIAAEGIAGAQAEAAVKLAAIASRHSGASGTGAPETFAVGGRFSGRAVAYNADRAAEDARRIREAMERNEKATDQVNRNLQEIIRLLSDVD